MIARADDTGQKAMQTFSEAVKALPEEAQDDLRKIVAYGQAEDLSVGQTRDQVNGAIDGLPTHLQQQLKNAVLGLADLTPEQIRGLAMDGAVDGEIGSLAFALRGDPSSSMNNWKAVTSRAQGQPVTDGTNLAPPDTPQVAEENKQDKGNPTVTV